MTRTIAADWIRGHTDTIILNVLQQGDSYGYAIYKQIIALSNHQFELKEATLYSAFRRLEKEDHILSYWGDETQGGRRKYYRITETGLALYKKNRTDWDFAKEILEQLIKGGIHRGEK